MPRHASDLLLLKDQRAAQRAAYSFEWLFCDNPSSIHTPSITYPILYTEIRDFSHDRTRLPRPFDPSETHSQPLLQLPSIRCQFDEPSRPPRLSPSPLPSFPTRLTRSHQRDAQSASLYAMPSSVSVVLHVLSLALALSPVDAQLGGTFQYVGLSGASAQQMFLGRPNKVYIVDKTGELMRFAVVRADSF